MRRRRRERQRHERDERGARNRPGPPRNHESMTNQRSGALTTCQENGVTLTSPTRMCGSLLRIDYDSRHVCFTPRVPPHHGGRSRSMAADGPRLASSSGSIDRVVPPRRGERRSADRSRDALDARHAAGEPQQHRANRRAVAGRVGRALGEHRGARHGAGGARARLHRQGRRRRTSSRARPTTTRSTPAASNRPSAARRRCPIADAAAAPRAGVLLELPAGYFNVYRCLANRPTSTRSSTSATTSTSSPTALRRPRSGRATLQPASEAGRRSQDYRSRYATYRSDVDLQEVHRQHPFIVVWDDHEMANDAWSGGAGNHNASQGDWTVRQRAAYRAYLEWMPVREVDGSRHPAVSAFRVRRPGRSGHARHAGPARPAGAGQRRRRASPIRRARCSARRRRRGCSRQLRASQRAGTRWRILGQQILFSPLTPPGMNVLRPDVWDGYPAARERVFDCSRASASPTSPSSPATSTARGRSTCRATRGPRYDPNDRRADRWPSSSSRRQSARRRCFPRPAQRERRRCCSRSRAI